MTHRDRSGDGGPLGERVNEAFVRSDWRRSGQPSTGVVDAVAFAADLDGLELPPLHGYVETDALDALVTDHSSGAEIPIHVSFPYDGLEITVYSDGEIRIRPIDG